MGRKISQMEIFIIMILLKVKGEDRESNKAILKSSNIITRKFVQ